MNGKEVEDRTIAKGFIMFLMSERQRHIKDIILINEIITEVIEKWNFTPKEIDQLKKEAKKYVEF